MTEAPARPPEEARSPDLSWEKLDRLDWQLWVLAILLILVLGAGLLSFMLPAAFWLGGGLALKAPERAFMGFCVLLGLALVYLLQKQAIVRRLKRKLFEVQAALASAEREAVIQGFQTLPGTTQFRDTLAMEYRRASTTGSHLTVLLCAAPAASMEAMGRMTSLLRTMLRQGESLYRISNKAVAVILPGMQLSGGASLAVQVETLNVIPKHEIKVDIASYPEGSASLAELEGKLRE